MLDKCKIDKKFKCLTVFNFSNIHKAFEQGVTVEMCIHRTKKRDCLKGCWTKTWLKLMVGVFNSSDCQGFQLSNGFHFILFLATYLHPPLSATEVAVFKAVFQASHFQALHCMAPYFLQCLAVC